MAQVHSSLESALVVGGLFIAIAGPALWWVFFRMDAGPNQKNFVPEGIELMTDDEIHLIENSLDVKLPEDYAQFLRVERTSEIDSTTVLDSAGMIIEWTNEYRKGFSGLPAWQKELVYIGDEADACPYIINCKSGEVLCTDKGNVTRQPLSRHDSFADFVSSKVADNV